MVSEPQSKVKELIRLLDEAVDIADCATRCQQGMAALDPMARDGLLQISAHELVISHRGRPFLRNICMPFDAYLKAHGGDQAAPSFSATI